MGYKTIGSLRSTTSPAFGRGFVVSNVGTKPPRKADHETEHSKMDHASFMGFAGLCCDGAVRDSDRVPAVRRAATVAEMKAAYAFFGVVVALWSGTLLMILGAH